MLNKTLSLLVLICLLATANSFVLGQTQSYKSENSQQLNNLPRKGFLDKIDVNSSDRAKELFEKDSFVKVKKDSITTKAMQDADKAQQKKKFAGMNTTTAIIIGAALVAVIIIVFATKGDKEQNNPPYCDPLPCR